MSLTVQLLVLYFGRALLACLLVLLAVGLLAVHATVHDEAAGIAVLELDRVAPMLAAVGAHASWTVFDCNATHANYDPWTSVSVMVELAGGRSAVLALSARSRRQVTQDGVKLVGE